MRRFAGGLLLCGWLLGGCQVSEKEETRLRYTVRRVQAAELSVVDFGRAEVGRIARARPESSDHRPETVFRVLHDGASLYVRFDVKDRYVRSVQTAFQAPVCTDSCVEFFVRPRPDRGYFNFEVNAGGTLLLYYVEDPARTPSGLAKYTPVPEAWGRQVEVRSSLPRIVDPEVAEPLAWQVCYKVPLALLEAFAGESPLSGGEWRANFYKCGDRTSHPHWLSWSPVSALNFHLPECFGELAFE